MCLQTMGSLSPALPLWLLLIMQGVSADAGKRILSQVSFPPFHVLIICPGGCRKWAKLTQAKSICWSSLEPREIASRSLGKQSSQEQHAPELGAWEKCQGPIPIMSWLCSWPASPLLEARTPRPHKSGDSLLPDLPLTDLVLCLKDALSFFLRLPYPLHKFPFKEVCITDSFSFWFLGNV